MRHKSYVHSIATAVPSNVITEETVRGHADAWLGKDSPMKDGVIDLMHGMRVDRRHFAFSPEELLANKGLGWMNREFGTRVVALSEDACRRAIAAAGLEPKDIDMVLSTSCTGFMIPALDAHLVNRIGLRRDVVRMPFTELGCAGGAAAMGRAAEWLQGRPDANVLVLAAELTSATFQLRDLSKANIVASLLFGDGVAAMVMSGRRPERGGPFVMDAASTVFPDSLDMMGFDLRESGFHLVLSPRIPGVVRREVRPFVDTMLARTGYTRGDLSWFVLHPGGRKVLESLEETLEVTRQAVKPSWEVLRQYGNLSSATVLFILDELMRTQPPEHGALGLLTAFGPAFGAEASLLGWD